MDIAPRLAEHTVIGLDTAVFIYHLRPADALQAATALVHEATAFVTHDRQLMRLALFLDVVVLDDL